MVDPEALPLYLLPFEPDETTSDSSSSKRRRMFSSPLESDEEREDMESDGEGFVVQNADIGSRSCGDV